MPLTLSPITVHDFAGIPFYLKRDDWLHHDFTGNKARKFMALLLGSFPHLKTVISYGSAQANSLYSLAALASLKGWRCEFYVDRIAPWLKRHPIGNYRAALRLGAEVIEVRNRAGLHPRDYIQHVRKPDPSCFVIPEGGQFPLAESGVRHLAQELVDWINQQPKRQWCVALPSGTGTTAYYLHQVLKQQNIEVLTCPCVGGEDYLRKQFIALGGGSIPTILTLPFKHHFGRLYPEDYQIWRQLLSEAQVEFDLLYDPMMWRCLLLWFKKHSSQSLIYIHQGGILGNQSMLPRYQRLFRSGSHELALLGRYCRE